MSNYIEQKTQRDTYFNDYITFNEVCFFSVRLFSDTNYPPSLFGIESGTIIKKKNFPLDEINATSIGSLLQN